MLLNPPNLPGWNNFPIRDRVSNHFQIPTALSERRPMRLAYGEFWAGAAKSAKSLVFWTLGTGIGCGIVIGDLIIEGEHSHGAECGHIIIEMTNGRLCDTGQYGTLEAYAGAKGVVRRCQEALNQGKKSLLHDQLAAGDRIDPAADCASCGEGGSGFARPDSRNGAGTWESGQRR